MFTGLIEEVGLLAGVQRDADGALLEIRSGLAGELGEGDSVAVDGVCLTATEVGDGSFGAQAMNETLERSTLGSLARGAPVNLELPLRVGERLGGHIVQGHVDAVARVRQARPDGFARVLEIGCDAPLARYMVVKGSVALNGVSLTVASVSEEGFSVCLIPETLARTNLGQLAAGTAVNVEADVLAKHLERLLAVRA